MSAVHAPMGPQAFAQRRRTKCLIGRIKRSQRSNEKNDGCEQANGENIVAYLSFFRHLSNQSGSGNQSGASFRGYPCQPAFLRWTGLKFKHIDPMSISA